MSNYSEHDFMAIRSLVLEYSENNLTTALDILNLFLEENVDIINKAIDDLNSVVKYDNL